MNNPRLLKDKFKNAQEVTSLASTDRLAVIGGDGEPKRIGFSNARGNKMRVNPTPSSPQWIRVARFSDTASMLLSITTQWMNTTGSYILVSAILHPNNPNYNFLTVLSALSNNNTIPSVVSKCRAVTKNGSTSYLDIYYSRNTDNIVDVELVCGHSISMITPELNAQIPEGYSVKEFDLTAVGGGVNRYLSTTYAILQKGGLRNDQEENYEAILKEKMTDAVVARTHCTDIDQTMKSGIYSVDSTTLNHPPGAYRWGVLVVQAFNSKIVAQVYYPHQEAKMYVRVFWDTGSPGWVRFVGERVES